MEKLMRDASTIMLPPIGNEASWARVGSFVARHAEPAPLHGPRDLGLRLPFAPPDDSPIHASVVTS
jgi:hypothetical protein